MRSDSNRLPRAKLIILAVIILLILIPNLLGTTTVTAEKSEDQVKTLSELAGRAVITLNNADDTALLAKYLPDCEIITADTADELADAVLSGEAFALAVDYDTMNTLSAAYEDLCTMPGVIVPSAVGTADSWYYVMIRSENADFAATDKTLEDVKQKGVSIACLVGTTFADQIETMFPDAEIQYYNTNADMNTAVASCKADFGQWYADDVETIVNQFDNVTALSGAVYSEMSCFAMPKTEKGEKLRDEFNEYLAAIRENGEYAALEDRWNLGTADYHLDYTYTGENGTLNVVTAGTWNPNTFYGDGELTGKFIELVCMFCSEYGYTPNFSVADYSAELAGITTGVYDIMADIASETPERAETVNLTSPVFCTNYCITTVGETAGTVTVSRASNFINSIRSSFVKTFITENRWQMILSGLGVTAALALIAAVAGTLLGAGICALRMSRFTYANAFAQLYVKIIQGTPILILLLVLNYIVFGNTGMSAFWVCVIGFSMDFAAYTSEIFRTGIESVPPGQMRAARALGFGSFKAFRKVVFPQAMVRILPVFSGQLISMVKLTSIAGYISVMDLTKVSDLIRSRTFEAFFPLITTAVIYFLISTLLVSLLRTVGKKFDPATRDRSVKGVTEHD